MAGRGRTEARVLVTIWRDPDFLALDPAAQRLYLFLISQPDLSYCGVIPLRVSRWASKAHGLHDSHVMASLDTLAAGDRPFVVVDLNTEEVLVRSLIRRDGIWRQPNLFKAAAADADQVESAAIREVLLAELRRLPAAESTSGMIRSAHAAFVAKLEASLANPSPNPSGNPSPNPSAKGSPSPSAKGSTKTERSSTYPAVTSGSAIPQLRLIDDERTGQTANRSPSAKGSGSPSRKGSPKGSGDPSSNPPQGYGVSVGGLELQQNASRSADSSSAKTDKPQRKRTDNNKPAQALAKAYVDLVPMSRYPAIMQIAKKALDVGEDYDRVHAALLRLAADPGRSVTVDSLRIELNGPAKARADPRYAPGSGPFLAPDQDYSKVRL